LTSQLPILGVFEAVSLASGCLEGLIEAVERLESNLSPVLSPDRSPEKNDVLQNQADCDCVGQIMGLTHRIRDLTSRVEEIMGRTRL
jgi:hypothetical protein